MKTAAVPNWDRALNCNRVPIWNRPSSLVATMHLDFRFVSWSRLARRCSIVMQIPWFWAYVFWKIWSVCFVASVHWRFIRWWWGIMVHFCILKPGLFFSFKLCHLDAYCPLVVTTIPRRWVILVLEGLVPRYILATDAWPYSGKVGSDDTDKVDMVWVEIHYEGCYC